MLALGDWARWGPRTRLRKEKKGEFRGRDGESGMQRAGKIKQLQLQMQSQSQSRSK